MISFPLKVGLTMPYHMMFYLLPSLGEKRGLCLLRFTLITLACSALARRVIAGSWLFAICIATVIIYWNAWEYPGHCDFAGVVPRNYMLCVVMPLFTLLFIVLIVTYVRIQRVAAQQARRLSSPHVHLSTSASHWHSGTKSLQVVSFVLGCFCICWLPYLIIGTLLVMGVHSGELPLAYSLSFSFAMANSCMNPIIYAWKNKDFKCAFRELLSCGRTQREQRGCEAAHHSARGSRASVFRHSSADSNSAPVFSVHLPAGDSMTVGKW
ncbi:hypothetical protein B566_EDAN004002 [Ephemera danica]|nr:hypothetical protein B566_EDAN004002 [Ephemera danica]